MYNLARMYVCQPMTPLRSDADNITMVSAANTRQASTCKLHQASHVCESYCNHILVPAQFRNWASRAIGSAWRPKTSSFKAKPSFDNMSVAMATRTVEPCPKSGLTTASQVMRRIMVLGALPHGQPKKR